MRTGLAAIGLVAALGACTAPTLPLQMSDFTGAPQEMVIATSYANTPFARGAVAVVARVDGEVKGYNLVPCGQQFMVCADDVNGLAAPVIIGRSHHIVTGPYGATFFLGSGGSGWLRLPSGDVPLAWNPRIDGVPDSDPL